MKKQSPSISGECLCASGRTYANCCQPAHAGEPATTAEALMRSRYSAYVLRLEDYLLQTWHPDTRPATLGLAQDTQTKWLGLEVKRAESAENTALVEFIARYKINGKAEQLREISRFVKMDKNWYYIDGDCS